MSQRLHRVFGGEPASPDRILSTGGEPGHAVAIVPRTDGGADSRGAGPRRTVDDVVARHVMPRLHRPRGDEAGPAGTRRAP